MNDLLTRSAAQLARQLRGGALSPVEVVDAHIQRIEAVNPTINAVVTSLFEEARQQAQAMADNRPENPPPLWGLPVTIKDAFNVAGVRTTGGWWRLRDNVAEQDAEAVRLLKEAGVIILGKTNCPDLSMAVETDNPIFGLTRNPRDPAYSVGGSSGGEAAIIAAGGSPLGLGSDIAGSVRLPAAFTGIVSLKPSAHRIPEAGHIPDPGEALMGWGTVGPMARRVEDLALALSVLSREPVRDPEQIELHGRRAIVPAYPLPPAPAVRKAVNGAVDALQQAGMILEKGVNLPVFKAAFEFTTYAYQNGLDRLLDDLVSTERVADASLSGLGTVKTLATRVLGPLGYPRGVAFQQDMIDQFADAIGEGGVMVWPVFALTPRKHGFAGGLFGSPAYTAIFNLLGMPSVVIPVHWLDNGLPVAVQVLARPGDDEVALAAAGILEQAFGGWQIADNARITQQS